ncbi:FecCD family ABC transporter permease [Glaciecola sp. 2405UD65-10]|uniref:FecCD family ABC transporter permease n=1 Tax=Glaciecola sp. 2405UD65-10 TaxID=3397244 RepID=UPI003B5C22A2
MPPVKGKPWYAYVALYLGVNLLLSALYLFPNLILSSELSKSTEIHILFAIKIPIYLTAILVGWAISSASAALQVTLQNPLADPGLLGVSSGASFMAAVCLFIFASIGIAPNALFFEYSMYWMPLVCFAGACLSGLLIFAVAKKIGQSISSFVLAGIAISTLFSALVGWLYLVAPAQAMKSLTFWLMGSLQYTNYTSLTVAGSLIIFALILLYLKSHHLNKLYLGAQAAANAGVNVESLQRQIFLLVALLVGASVSIAGSVAFLGLLVPHVVRRIHGYNNQHVQILSGILGANVMLVCANANEYIFSTQVPLSMITASLGAPLFLYVLFANKNHQ